MATVTVTHPRVNAAAPDPAAHVDSVAWNEAHTVTGLENVDNTADADKPVSTAQAAAIAAVQSDVDAHVADTANPHSVTNAQVGLGNADNTSDADKPVSTATQTALDARLRFDASQSLTAAQQAQVSVNANVSSALQNLCTNPGMQVWQNDTTLAAMAHRTVLADGYLFGTQAGTSVWTGTRETATLPDATVPAKLKVQVTTAEASPAAGVDRHLRWAVYGKDFEPYASSNIKIKFSVRAKKTGIHCIAVVNEVRDRTYVVEYTISAADTWESKEVTIPFGTKTGTWNTGDGYGFGIRFSLVTGTTYQTTAGAWQTGNFTGTSSQVNVGDNTANYYEITKLQVYPDSVPTFSLPSYDEALNSAQRQYRVITTDVAGVNLPGFAADVNSANFDYFLPFPMMAPPTVSIKGTLDTDIQAQTTGGAAITGGTFNSFARSKHIAKWQYAKTAGFTSGNIIVTRLVTTGGKLVFDGHLA